MMRVLVTGANGFIGRALSGCLSENNVDVISMVRSDVPVTFGSKLVLDVTREENLEKLTRTLESVDSVVHTIGLTHAKAEASSGNQNRFEAINVKTSALVGEACKQAKINKLVYLSSIKAAAEVSPISPVGEPLPITETMAPRPAGLYGESKLRAEQALQTLLQHSATRLVIIRPPLVYGIGQKGNMETLFKAIKLGLPLPLANAANSRSIISVDNLSHAIMTVLTQSVSRSDVYFIADECLSTAELIRRIADATGVKARLFKCPEMFLKLVAKPDRLGKRLQKILGSLIVDDTKFRQEFDWQPAVSPDDVFRAIAASSR